MYQYLFGPVPSRRLGMSLGVDLVPRKVCSLDCVYCEVGKTTRRTLERREYVPFDSLTAELQDYFANRPDPDYFTFSGSGEPTLNSCLGAVINFIKQYKPQIPVAVLTNGTLLFDPQVRKELMRADLVLPSLDAATEEAFQRINRPSPELSLERYLQGLIAFGREYSGVLRLEVFILPGYNDSPTDIAALREMIPRINPDSVQLNTLDRPGTESGLHGSKLAALRRIKQDLAMDNVEIIAAGARRKNIRSYREDAEQAILATISRRPCTLDDLARMLGLHPSEINKYLDVLDAENRIETFEQERGVFYQSKATQAEDSGY